MKEIPADVVGVNREEWLLANYMIGQVVDKASGASENFCFANYPRDVFFVGNLSPIDESEQSRSRAEYKQKLSPSAFGAEFKIRPIEASFKFQVKLEWDCFYRVFPTYDEQTKWLNVLSGNDQGQQRTEESGEDEDSETPDETAEGSSTERQSNRRHREDLYIKFKKIKCQAVGLITLENKEEGWVVSTKTLTDDIERCINDVRSQIASDPSRLRLRVAGQLFKLSSDVLSSEVNFNRYLGELTIEPNNRWNWRILCETFAVTDSHDEIGMLFQFVNATNATQNEKTIEPYIFNSRARFEFNENIVRPFELELAPKSFRFDRNLWGRGFNCGLEGSSKIFTTEHTPIHTQFRYKTNDTPEAKFVELASNPIPILKGILKVMREYLNEWDLQEVKYQNSFTNEWNEKYKAEYDADRRQYELEIERFESGLTLIEKDKDIQTAFKLANETFRRAGLDKDGKEKKNKWRLFQIVFMVSQIPGMAALNPLYKEQFEKEREFVDIIYFPTGGGKTEAYLAVLIFHCFYDRMRGKTAGVTCWIRFPLRLLTLQQTQRLADVVGNAEIVRAEQTDKRIKGKLIHQFSVGYYVGSEATPNEIKPEFNGIPEPSWSQAKDPSERSKWRRVVICPSCKTNSVSIEFDEARAKIIHKCSNKTCKFSGGIIPVYVIDNEIYRYLPSVMVGTIDKLAVLGLQRKLSMVFGKVHGYCDVHGFYNGTCTQKGCTDPERLKPVPPVGISGPTLFLQDELHLLNEGFGTFDSHYETFAQHLLTELGATEPLKIIASSATIEKYERQVEHLYGKSPKLARIFPGLGPTLQSSFYAKTEKFPQRIFVGIIPHNKTILNSILEIIEYHHRAMYFLASNSRAANVYQGDLVPGSEDMDSLLNLYYTSLTYFLATRDLDKIKTDIESHINAKFSNEGFNSLAVKELTGNTPTDEVTRILERLEEYHSRQEGHETVLASNMISHGVDIDRFNAMIFYGMPRKNAEYIQASSRVGRSHIGVVFNCFHPIRERDQSHYAYFNKYHEFLGQLVEPVAINRWSAFGLRKTVPGLFLAVILQIFSNRTSKIKPSGFYFLNNVSRLVQSGEIKKDEVKQILKNAYNAGISGDERNRSFEKKIDTAVDFYFSIITNSGTSEDMLSKVLIPKPMMSLRDIDDPVTININRLGEQWSNKD